MSIDKYEKIQLICQRLLVAILIVYFGTLMYSDIHITYYHSLSFLDCVFSGKFLDFYNVTFANPYLEAPAVYYFPIYLIFSVWNLPLWLLSRFGGIDPFSTGCLLWLKGLVVLFLVGCCYYIRKIMQQLENEDIEFGMFLFLSSFLVVLPTFSVAQYDVISIFFMLWGIFRGAVEDKLSIKTALIFSVAIPLKFFALFTYFFFLLLKEKRIFHIIKNLAIGMLGTAISIIPFFTNDEFHRATSSFNMTAFAQLFDTSIVGGLSDISLFFLCFFIVCCTAYAWKPSGTKDLLWRMLWLGTFFYLGFFAFVSAHPYWIILLAIFVVPLAIQNSHNVKLNLILEVAMEVGIIALQACVFNWVYLYSDAFSSLLMKYVPVGSDLLGVSNFYDLINIFLPKPTKNVDRDVLTTFLSGVNALFVVAGGALLVLNFPLTRPNGIKKADSNLEIKTGIYCIRLVCLIAYFALSVAITYFI